MNWLRKIFASGKEDNLPVQREEDPEKVFLLHATAEPGKYQWYSTGYWVYFVNEELGIRRLLLDDMGRIHNFPGIRKKAFWAEKIPDNGLAPRCRYETSFTKGEKGWIMRWTVQPDGRYWADEGGFGMENDTEVVLYAVLDDAGNFTGPFRICRYGARECTIDRFLKVHAQSQACGLKIIRENTGKTLPGDLFPQLWCTKREHLHSLRYQLGDREEAEEYWNHPVLSQDLLTLSRALLEGEATPQRLLGQEYTRIQACMTLFYRISEEPVFREVLDRFFDGKMDADTVLKT